jgi:hypothetical protein
MNRTQPNQARASYQITLTSCDLFTVEAFLERLNALVVEGNIDRGEFSLTATLSLEPLPHDSVNTERLDAFLNRHTEMLGALTLDVQRDCSQA